jgi:fructose-bisphosphate aldolase, class II
VKVNLDTDMQYAFTHAIEDHLGNTLTPRNAAAHVGVDKHVYDPRSWGRKAEAAMAARVVEASEVLGSSGRTLARS